MKKSILNNKYDCYVMSNMSNEPIIYLSLMKMLE